MHVITIITSNYALHAQRLVKSLKRHYLEIDITVYGDDTTLEPVFTALGARLRVLPEISTLGVKRAKFTAYSHAAREGGFIFLDADIIVVNPLPALIDVEDFTACRDDLRECPFISDPKRPWEYEPDLSGEQYFNSGVFAVPAGFYEFFREVEQDARDDEEWLRYTISGKLYDNHFLCAKIAQHLIQINFISEYEYNWQGFRSFGELNCYLDQARNLRSLQGGLLRLVHFAGIQDIDAYISSLPLDIIRVLVDSIGKSEAGALELMSSALNTKVGVEARLKLVMARAMCQIQANKITNPGVELPLLTEPESVTSIALSAQESDFLWNGLRCGSLYLSASEYQRLRNFVVETGVNAVLEFGAGYTTALFAGLVPKQVALEGWDGPWLEFARTCGADARLAPFSPEVGFDEIVIIQGVESVFSAEGSKMIFIDSLRGAANRAMVIEQVLQYARDADFYVVHDSVRDSSIVYRLSAALGLQVMDHFPSLRGLTFLGRGNPLRNQPTSKQPLRKRVANMQFNVKAGEAIYNCSGSTQKLFVHLQNIGEEMLTAFSDGLGFSMHLMGGSGEIIQWDMPRYSLPVDLSPGDCVSFWVEVPSSPETIWACFDFVKEGEFWWSDISSVPCPRLILK